MTLDDPKIGEALASLSDQKSNFRMMVMGPGDSFERVEVSVDGIPALMDQYFRRMAAAASIPATRFLGTPPVGLNSTGEGDMQNYAIHVGAMQVSMLDRPLSILDQIVARHMGLEMLPPYEWNSLIDLSEHDKLMNTSLRVTLIREAVADKLIQPEEGRNILIKTEDMFSELETYDVPTPEELEARRQEMMAVMQGGEDAGLPSEGPEGQEPAAQEADQDEEEGQKGVAGVRDQELNVGAAGDADFTELDDIELSNNVENEFANGVISRAVNPTLSRLINRTRERFGQIFSHGFMADVGELRLRVGQRSRVFATYHGRYVTAKPAGSQAAGSWCQGVSLGRPAGRPGAANPQGQPRQDILLQESASHRKPWR